MTVDSDRPPTSPSQPTAMRNIRLIARLDVKAPNLIKGIHLEGLRKIGSPNAYATKYYQQGIDEIIYMDIVASLYERNSLLDIIEETTRNIFVPLTVGGGIRSIEDVRKALRAGADKVAVNTAAVASPKLLTEIAQTFGSQCLVLSIEAKRWRDREGWEAFTDNGRERTGLDVVEWAKRGAELGAGEILLTSGDQEGTRRGFDTELVAAVSRAVEIPVIASGGMGSPAHLTDVVENGHADAVAMADILHYDRMPLPDIREAAIKASIPVRKSISVSAERGES